MDARCGRAVRPGFVRAACCALALSTLAGCLLATGCSSAPSSTENPPLVQVVDGAVDFPRKVTVGRVSLGYPDTLWVIDELEPRTTDLLDKKVAVSQTLVGDDDFSHGFLVGEISGIAFDDLLGYAEQAQEQAPARVAVLEEKAKESEQSAQMFGGLAEHYRNVVYSGPDPIVLNGCRAFVFGESSAREGATGVSKMCFVEVDRDVVGFVVCGYHDYEYDADPAFWDDIFASLEVR